ncbi:class I SAM-dependent methyltransferase [Ochrobactrum sp. C6C9]|uniref:class I SAM-dependent methyltransferase n=1 Tax=Ochrobactrum sp. C6C9 TaxID=2736662 RepID=UPI0035302FD5|nr:class I SAM-dependent methyltransferase [Ochrobactrum sp. C6C9]
MRTHQSEYWDQFYTNVDTSSPIYPSQFAAFALGEASFATKVIEFGCGNGRDAEFFASQGKDVLAFDASEVAINLCQSRNCRDNILFRKFAIGDPLEEGLFGSTETKTLLYARFFLHAITDEQERQFVSLASDILKEGSVLALEYRCSGDEENNKIFGNHYRRYIRHEDLCQYISENGFEILYEIIGKGLAKYKSEDALVGRCIAAKR